MFRFYTPVVRRVPVNPFFSAFDDDHEDYDHDHDDYGLGLFGLGLFGLRPQPARPQHTAFFIRPSQLTAFSCAKRRRCDDECECDENENDENETCTQIKGLGFGLCDQHEHEHEQEQSDDDMDDSDDEVRVIEHKRREQKQEQKPQEQKEQKQQLQTQQQQAQSRAIKKARTDSDTQLAPLSSFQLTVDENDKAFLLHVRAPNLEPDQLSLTVDKGVLTIKGQSKSERKHEEDGFSYTSQSFSQFSRSIPLSRHVDEDNISAKLEEKQGVTITLPKRSNAPNKAFNIPIASAVSADAQAAQTKLADSSVQSPQETKDTKENKETKESKESESKASKATEQPAPSATELSQLPEKAQERVAEYLGASTSTDQQPQTSTSTPSPTKEQDKDGWTMVNA